MTSHLKDHFSDKTAVITGGASGIGKAIAEALAKFGADVTILDMQKDLGEETVDAINANSGKAQFRCVDVTDFDSLNGAIVDAHGRTGRLDYMFNNAGISMVGGVNEFKPEDWQRLVDVNLVGVMNGCRAAYEIMHGQKSGHIINTASVAGLTPHPGSVFYAAAKHGVVGLSKSLRVEAARHGVVVSVLCPGVVDTPLIYGGGKYGKSFVDISPEDQRKAWEKFKPMPAAHFAQSVLRDVRKGKPIIIRPRKWGLVWQLDRLSPGLGLKLTRLVYERKLKELGID